MNQFIDINNRAELQRLLLSLNADTLPLWGKMKPQQMVEHLVEEVKWTNGKKVCTCDRPEEDRTRDKQKNIYSDTALAKNVFLEELPANYSCADIAAATAELIQELNDFDEYFKTPGQTSVHGGFGPLTHQEWLIWHGKHFTHHLKQFKLIKS